MKRRSFLDYLRDEFFLLMGVSGEELWSSAEEMRRRRRLGDVSIQEGRFVGRFSGERPYRAELLVPVFCEESWSDFLSKQERSAYIAAHLFAELLPWRDEYFQTLVTPAGIIPKDEQGNGVGAYSPYTTALLQELGSQLENDPFVIFRLRGRGKEETLEALRTIRAALHRADPEIEPNTEPGRELVDRNSEEIPLDGWETISPELFQITYSLRADELPALLFKRLESIPLPGKTDNVEHALSELYVHIAKRAQAFGLSLRR